MSFRAPPVRRSPVPGETPTSRAALHCEAFHEAGPGISGPRDAPGRGFASPLAAGMASGSAPSRGVCPGLGEHTVSGLGFQYEWELWAHPFF